MGSKIVAFIGVLLLGVGTLCGPVLWIMSLACFYTSWRPGLELVSRVELFYAATVFGCWALWGLTSGMRTLPRVMLGLGSMLNMVAGFLLFVSGEPHGRTIGLLFLGYSLIQLIAARRPRVHVVS